MSMLDVPGTNGRVRLNCLQIFVSVGPGATRLITGLWANKTSKFAVTSRRAEALLATVDRRVLHRPALVLDGSVRGLPSNVWLDDAFPIEDSDHDDIDRPSSSVAAHARQASPSGGVAPPASTPDHCKQLYSSVEGM
jgi:hypothetical protein